MLPSATEAMAKKLQLSYKDIESRLDSFKAKVVSASEVGYEILKAFGKSEKDVSRYKEGKDILKTFDGLLIKGLFGYKSVSTTTSPSFTVFPVLPVSRRTFLMRERSSRGRNGFGI